MARPEIIPLRPDFHRSPPPAAAVAGLSIGEYLIRRLQDYGIGHVFGIPGDYVLQLLLACSKHSPIDVVGCTREDCAGFAADAYARVNGMGAVCVTYCVGGLSLCNSHRRGVCREVAGGGDHRLAGHEASGSTTRCCITRCATFARSSRSSRSSASPAPS